MREPSTTTIHLSVPASTVTRAQTIRDALASRNGGVGVKQSEVLRAALERGLSSLAGELGAPAEASAA